MPPELIELDLSQAVLIDALGTLVELEPPGPRLVQNLAARGLTISQEEADGAFKSEIAYYRSQHLRGRDAPGLEALRADCAEILHRALPSSARESISPPELLPIMLGSLHFKAYPDATPALDALRGRGLRVLVLSNWDISLQEVLAQAGLEAEGLISSAEAGAAKPDPRAFKAALALAGVPAGRAVHVGDSLLEDVAGARAAGITPILLCRGEAPVDEPGLAVISSLRELA